MLVGYMRVSKADGSQVNDLQRDSLIGGVRPAKGIFKAGQQPAMIALPRFPRSAPDAQTILTSR
jgi:hypothetical protein